MDILEKIVASTKERVEREKKAGLPQRGGQGQAQSHGRPRDPFRFERALRQPGISMICEVKKASPSKGVIAEKFPYISISCDYEAAGADAISVLTEPEFFQGDARHLAQIRDAVGLPLLRKDFIVDRFQIEQSACLGADAILLICAVLPQPKLAEYIRAADSLGLSCLVEAHDEGELMSALRAGARVVGVNNRDLKTFAVDTGNSLRLRRLVPDDVVFVSESGVRDACDVELLRSHGVGAVLVGEALMRAPDKREALAALRGRQ